MARPPAKKRTKPTKAKLPRRPRPGSAAVSPDGATALVAETGGLALASLGGENDTEAIAELLRQEAEAGQGRILAAPAEALIVFFPDARLAAEAACTMQRLLEPEDPTSDDHPDVRIALLDVGGADAEAAELPADRLRLAAKLLARARSGEIILPEGVVEQLGAGQRTQCRALRPTGGDPEPLQQLEWREEPPTALTRLPQHQRERLRLQVEGAEWTLDETRPRVRFGRGADNDLSVSDRYSSRHHGEVSAKNGKFYVTDASANGTLLVRPTGRSIHVHNETVLLEGAGTLHLGRVEGAQIAFVLEARSADGGWQPTEAPPTAAGASTGDASLFRREGEYWTLAYEGQVLRLRDAKGLQYIARLLQQPDQEFHVLDLATMGDPAQPGHASASARAFVHEGAQVADGGGAGPALDASAKAAYKRRLVDLRADLEEAEEFNDAGRAARAGAEIQALSDELSQAVGLGGRDRETASNAERARVMVTMRVRAALKKIAQAHPALGSHLMAGIKTGRFCVYHPDPAHPVPWSF